MGVLEPDQRKPAQIVVSVTPACPRCGSPLPSVQAVCACITSIDVAVLQATQNARRGLPPRTRAEARLRRQLGLS